MSTPKPLPMVAEAPEHWEAAREGRYVLPRCRACRTFSVPPVYDCFSCHAGEEQLEWTEVSGRGTLYTFNVYHRAYHPGFAGDVPYNTAVVELNEGPMVTTRIVGCANQDLVVGMPVQVTFIDHDDSSGIRLPVFTRDPAAEDTTTPRADRPAGQQEWSAP